MPWVTKQIPFQEKNQSMNISAPAVYQLIGQHRLLGEMGRVGDQGS